MDRESVSGWLDGIERLTVAGERFTTRRANRAREGAIEGRVLEIVPKRRLRILLHGPWRLLREVELNVALEPDDSGTRVSLRTCYRLRWLGWLVRPLLRLRAEVALHRASRGFRAAIEDESARRRRVRRERLDRRRGDGVRRSLQHEALLRTAD